MRPLPDLRVEAGRLRSGPFASSPGDCHGAFDIIGPHGTDLHILSGGCGPQAEGWQHVSVSARRMPNWIEMCFVKDLFWDQEECVIQYHPPRSRYVNCHPTCLHLWKPDGIVIPTPPMWMIG